MTLTPADIERLIPLTRRDDAVGRRALDILRTERDYWIGTTLQEFEDFMMFVWARDYWLWLYLAMSDQTAVIE